MIKTMKPEYSELFTFRYFMGFMLYLTMILIGVGGTMILNPFFPIWVIHFSIIVWGTLGLILAFIVADLIELRADLTKKVVG